MIKNRKKKGFTIVELVIVIAVVAILAAVLIPTFANVMDKANQSADIQATRQMNVALAAGSIPDVPQNAKEMIAILADAGFNAENCLVPVTTTYKFYWTGPEYNTIVLAQVPEAIREYQEPEVAVFSLLRTNNGANEPQAQSENDVEIKVICPTENEELVEAVMDQLEKFLAWLSGGCVGTFEWDLPLYNLENGKEILKDIVSDKTDEEPGNGNSSGTDTIEIADEDKATVAELQALNASDFSTLALYMFYYTDYPVKDITPVTENCEFYWDPSTCKVVLVNDQSVVIYPEDVSIENINECDALSEAWAVLFDNDEVAYVFSEGGDLTLTGDYTLASDSPTGISGNATIDLDKHTLVIDCQDFNMSADVTIENGTIQIINKLCGINLPDGGTLNLKNVQFEVGDGLYLLIHPGTCVNDVTISVDAVKGMCAGEYDVSLTDVGYIRISNGWSVN